MQGGQSDLLSSVYKRKANSPNKHPESLEMPSNRFNMTTSNSACLTLWEGSTSLTVVTGCAVDKMVEGRMDEFINHQIVRC